MSALDRLLRILHGRTLPVFVCEQDEHRLRCFMDRCNHTQPDDHNYDLDSDRDLEVALLVVLQEGLREYERQDGLVFTPDGLVSAEHAAECRRRRREEWL